MRVKFDSLEYRWLAVRERPLPGSPMVRKIETGLDFEVEDEPINDDEGNIWYRVIVEPSGYVMGKYVTEIESPEDRLHEMKFNDLRKLAKESGIKLNPDMKKEDIIKALLDG